MTDRALLQRALDALVCAFDQTCSTGRQRDWRTLRDCIAELRAALAAPVAPAFAPSPECDSPRICSTAKVCAGLFDTKQQCGAPVAPAGMALVPLRMTQAMRDATDSEGWTWEDLLAAAEAITEDQHTELAAPVVPAGDKPAMSEPITVEAVATVLRHEEEGMVLDWLIEGGVCALCPGQVLGVATRPITDDDGAGEVYTAPPDVQRDAERYRWLRDSRRIPASDDPEGHIIVAAGGGEDVIWSSQLDAHIDAAMSAKEPT